MATQMAFALLYEYNKKIGINKRFKCMNNSKFEPAMAHIDYKYVKCPSILPNVYLRVYMSHLLKFRTYIDF
jgi:hypothetical protein